MQTATKIAVRMHLQQLNTCRMHCSGSTAGKTDGQQVCSAAAVRQGSAAGTAAHHSRHQREPAVVIVADRVLHHKTHPRAGVTIRTGNPQQPWSLSRSVSCRVCSSLAVPLCCPPAHLAEPLGGCAIPQRLLLMVSEGLGAHHSRILAVLAPHPATEACKRRLLATGGSGGGGAASRPALERRRRRTDSLTWLSPFKAYTQPFKPAGAAAAPGESLAAARRRRRAGTRMQRCAEELRSLQPVGGPVWRGGKKMRGDARGQWERRLAVGLTSII